MDTQLYENKHILKSWTHNYRSHDHTIIRKQTHSKVMDTQLYENKHIPQSWSHDYSKTNIYRRHGDFGRCVSMTSVVVCPWLWDMFVFVELCVHDFGICLFSYSCVSMTSVYICFRIVVWPWTHNYTITNIYRRHGHTTIRNQTHIEVMDTKLCENKHIYKSWTQNCTKTNTYRSHGHKTIRKQTHLPKPWTTTIRKQTYTEVMDTQLYEIKHISKSWTKNYTKTYSFVSMTSICVCFRTVLCPRLIYVFIFA
jgi:uncharacterized phage-associated protein